MNDKLILVRSNMPRKKVTEDVLERMKHLKEEGPTCVEIGQEFGLFYPTVANYLRGKRRVRR